MKNLDKSLNILEDLIESHKTTEDEKSALNEASEALSFMYSLHDMFREAKMTDTEEPTSEELESLVDSLSGELFAACMILSDPGLTVSVSNIANNIHQNLGEEAPSYVKNGFLRLADRINRTKEAVSDVNKILLSEDLDA